jgi:cytochrome c peroxidase
MVRCTLRLQGLVLLALAACLAAPLCALAVSTGEPIVPLPPTLNADPKKAEIGRQLFRDVRVSANGKVACLNCHDVTRGGADSRDFSVGLYGARTDVNAPTVFNAALNFRQFWNGRANSLEDQLIAVISSPVEMGSSLQQVVSWVANDAAYKKAFADAYRDGVTAANVLNALASYERTLITPDSRFDQFLRGDSNAITAEEKSGYEKFKQYGCIACHQGVNVGGNMFQKFGVMTDYFAVDGKQSDADLGRYVVTRDDDDRHVFKVPSLRNVALTAPYFHDASAATLEAAVDIMFRVQLGRTAAEGDRKAIVAFLKTLSARPMGEPQ